eukprot:TRINITY_DN3943_c4_g2_i2.p1 TRINITY_DN3943_c4_g2~~TRINITY_DN3943_c4_g2_i2.p1  ORF type:complete len:211 (+),score=43.12 TRINITY_DN3943_c4_g2_i2:243-875(+)
MEQSAIEKCLELAIVSLNKSFRRYIKKKDVRNDVKHSGATGVAVLIVGDRIYAGNVGDARAVLYTGGDPIDHSTHGINGSCKSENVIRLTKDHKPDDEEERVRAAGGYIMNSRVNGILGISRSLGDFYMHPWVIIDPYIFSCPLPKNEDSFIIIGCDGVWDELSDEQACNIVHRELRPNRCTEAAQKVRDYAYFLGSDDNISSVVIKLNR